MKQIALVVLIGLGWFCPSADVLADNLDDAVPPFVRPSWESDYREIERQIAELAARPPAVDPRQQPHMHDVQALVWPTDRDPLDVERRRAAALLEDLADRVEPSLAEDVADRLAAVRAQAARLSSEDASGLQARKALYLELRAARRRLALANPRLDFDSILFNTGRLLGAHIQTHFRATHATAPGELYRLKDFRSDSPTTEPLLHEVTIATGRCQGERLRGGAFQTLDLACDGRKLLFEWCARKRPEDLGPDTIFNPAHFALDNTFNIYCLDLESGRLEQLTDTRYNDAAPCWLPDGRIAFISDRREVHVRCHPDIADGRGKRQNNLQTCASLFSMKADGSDVVPLSWHETSEVFPRVTNDGRIVYTRWDYIDREFHAGHAIWFCMPDGRDPRSPHGNYPHPHDSFDLDSPYASENGTRFEDWRHLRPWTEYGIRPIPGSAKFIAAAGIHHGQARGELVLIDTRVPDDGAMAQVRCITSPSLPTEGATMADYTRRMPYAWPCPLSEDYYLVTHLPRGSLVLLDRFGNRDVLWHRPGMLFALPEKPRPRPPVIPTETFQGERAGLPEHRPATIGVMNVYESDFAWPKDAQVAALRVVQIFPRPWSSPFQRVGESYMSGTINRMAVGTVPVEPDGSAYFEAPVECEIYFQALDAEGRAIQSMRSGTYVHPGEQMTCVGCHESKWKQPPVGQAPMALRRAPSKLQPEIGGLEPVNFYRLVRPVLEAKCLPCHRKENAPLKTSEYGDLRGYAFYFHASGGALQAYHGGYRSGSGHVGARASRMGQALFDERHRHYLAEGHFTEEDRRRITLWLDLNSLELGSASIDPEDQARQRAGEVVWPKLDFDPKNPQRTESVPVVAQ